MSLLIRHMKKGLVWLLAIVGVAAILASCANKDDQIDLTVYKNPQCACCDKWVEHMREAGFTVKVKRMSNMKSIKDRYGIEQHLQSCHTAIHNETGLFFEGHIPSEHIVSLLENRSELVRGLTVPGMPVGSPGMEIGDRKDSYEVLLITKDNDPTVYAREN